MIAADNKDIHQAIRHQENQSLLSARFEKRDILGTLKLLADEPDYHSELFGYRDYTERLFDLLSYSLPDKAFAICLDARWGEGKTSLLKRIYQKLVGDSRITNNHAIWFDAWKHEDILPVISLIQKILDMHQDQDDAVSEKIQTLLSSLSTLHYGGEAPEIRNRSTATNTKVLKRIMDGIDTLAEDLDSMIGDTKLFIFIDHLDRCKPSYIHEMLKAITVYLNAKKIKFIVAVDMGRLESLLQPRSSDKDGDSIINRATYLDKVFQLRLVLPSKHETMMREYVEKIAGRFPKEIQDFLAHALPSNPRKVKESLNLAFYVSTLVEEDEYGKVFAYILVWSILATSFRNLSSIIHERPETLFDLAIIASQTKDFGSLVDILTLSKSDESLFFINTKLPRNSVSPLATKLCYSHVMHDRALYNYLKALSLDLELDLESKSNQIESMKKAIKYVSLIS